MKVIAGAQPSRYHSDGVDILTLSLTEDETLKMYQTCLVFSGLNIPFNLIDGALRYMLFNNPTDIGLFEVKKMSDVQAAILFLRECLDPDNPIIFSIKNLNSRCTSAENLFDAIKEHAVEWKHHSPWAHWRIVTDNLIAQCLTH
jgi:hypothetical protein